MYLNSSTCHFSTDPVVVTTPCQLIAAGVAVQGTLTITNTYFAFETDPSQEENRKIDPQVGNFSSSNSFLFPFFGVVCSFIFVGISRPSFDLCFFVHFLFPYTLSHFTA